MKLDPRTVPTYFIWHVAGGGASKNCSKKYKLKQIRFVL